MIAVSVMTDYDRALRRGAVERAIVQKWEQIAAASARNERIDGLLREVSALEHRLTELRT